MEELSLIQRVAVWVLPVLFAITVHEVAHGWVAKQLGDPTAWMMGRLTLNPIKHIDPVGTLLVPGAMILLGGAIFGWAKPVPVVWGNLRHPKRDMAIVALAGPMANLLMALFWVMITRIGILLPPQWVWLGFPMLLAGVAGIFINIVLMSLNLLPIPPLDGGRVLSGLLPNRWSAVLDLIEPYGLFILVGLLVSGLLGQVLWPIIGIVSMILSPMAGLSPQTFMQILQLIT
jgi:Zn-dependent protease